MNAESNLLGVMSAYQHWKRSNTG